MMRQIVECCEKGDLELLISISNKCIISYDDCLVYAVEYGQLEIIKYAISKGASVTIIDSIRTAAVFYNIQVLQYFINEYFMNEKSINIRDFDNILKYIAGKGNVELLEYLVSKGADIHSENDFAFRWACYNGHLHMVKYIEKFGPDMNAGNNSAIHFSSRNGHFEVVKYLVEKGADANQINSERCKRYLLFCDKMKIKAQKKIYYWWIEICYNLHHHSGCGKRMAERNWKSFEDELKILNKA